MRSSRGDIEKRIVSANESHLCGNTSSKHHPHSTTTFSTSCTFRPSSPCPLLHSSSNLGLSPCSPQFDQPQRRHCEVSTNSTRSAGCRHRTHILPAKPSTALSSLRSAPSAFISSTSTTPASALQPRQENGPPLSVTGKPRREVPLPSQEKKEGVMQYALFVPTIDPPFT